MPNPFISVAIAVLPSLIFGCVAFDHTPVKSSHMGLIATPASYYSTPKARDLAVKYKESLDKLIEQIVRNSKTSNLQFANNISSVGGIGFFTHAATHSADERYLEVVLGVPEVFETKGEYSDKFFRLFSTYGAELLAILLADPAIYEDRDVSGYGINLSWRQVNSDTSGSSVTIDRLVAYFSKEQASKFLKHQVKQSDLLAGATIFGVDEGGPMRLVSFRPQEIIRDARPEIREETLVGMKQESKPPARMPGSAVPPKTIAATFPAEYEPENKSEQTAAVVEKELSGQEASVVTASPSNQLASPNDLAVDREAESLASDVTKSDDPKIAEVAGVRQEDAAGDKVASSMAPQQLESKNAFGADSEKYPEPQILASRPSQSSEPAETPLAGARTDAPIIEENKQSAPEVEGISVQSNARAPAPGAEAHTKDTSAIPLDSPKSGASVASDFNSESVQQRQIDRRIKQEQRQAMATNPAPDGSAVPQTPSTLPEKGPSQPRAVDHELQRVSTIAPQPTASLADAKTDAPAITGEQPEKKDASVRDAQSALQGGTDAAITRAATPETTPINPQKELNRTEPQKMALLKNKPNEALSLQPTPAKPAPKALEGYVIQLAFADKRVAKRWAESFERRGFAVSLTEAGSSRSIRVRLGNFAARDDAERQLRSMRQDGMKGIVINLPQAYQPKWESATSEAQESVISSGR